MLSPSAVVGRMATQTLLASPRPFHAGPALWLASQDSAPRMRKYLFEKSLGVKSFGGSLWASSAFPLRITPVGSLEYPNLDRAFLRLTCPLESGEGLGRDGAKVNYKVEGHKLSVSNENISYPVSETGEGEEAIKQEVQIPMVYNVNASTTGNSSIKVKDLIESLYCHIKSESGNITASRIKTGNLNIESVSGDVLCEGAIQGTVKVNTDSGNVIGDKRFVGPSLDIHTESGDIRVASCYSDTSKFCTNKGSMNLRNIHNVTYIGVYDQGDVKVTGLDGDANIFVKKGDVDCHISQIRSESRIHVEEGNIHVRMSDTHPVKIHIEASEIIPDAKFNLKGELSNKVGGSFGGGNSRLFDCAIQPDKFSPTILVIAENGQVILESQDWAASMGLKMPTMNS